MVATSVNTFYASTMGGGEDVVVSTQAKLSVGLSWFLRLFEELRDKMIETLNKGLIKGKLNPL